jgi:ProP effector
MIARLAEQFPKCFVLYAPRRRPLKVGIFHDLVVAGAGAEADLRSALRYYSSCLDYLRRCTAGADRINLEGLAAGAVTADEATHAAARLAKLRQRAKTRQQAKHPPAPAPEPAPTGRLSLSDLRQAAAARRAAAA